MENKNKEYTLEHFVNVFHKRHLSCYENEGTRLAKLILYLSGNYSLAHEHIDTIQEAKYEQIGKTKPLAQKIDLLLKIFNKCCKLTCTHGFEDRLGMIEQINVQGIVPKEIDEFVKQKLYEYEMEDYNTLQKDNNRVSLIDKGIKQITKKETAEYIEQLMKN